jgi:hypothetical protein
MNPCTLAFYPPHLVQDDESAAPLHADYKILHPDVERDEEEGEGQGQGEGRRRWTAAWKDVDAKFRRALPDAWYMRRMAYRALILQTCAGIRMLDGLQVGRRERAKMDKLLKGVVVYSN